MKTRPAQAPIAILCEPSSYRDALEHEFAKSGVSVHAAPSWDEGRKLLAQLGSCLTILDENLPGLPEGDWTDRLAVLGSRSQSVFVLGDSAPSAEATASLHGVSALGYLARESPFEENLFRVHAYLTGRSPSQFIATPRARIVGNVRISRAHDGERPPLCGLILNLSRTGLLVSAISLPDSGARVELSIDLPGSAKPILARGCVMWRGDGGPGSGPSQAGIRFEELDQRDVESISRYVLDRLQRM